MYNNSSYLGLHVNVLFRLDIIHNLPYNLWYFAQTSWNGSWLAVVSFQKYCIKHLSNFIVSVRLRDKPVKHYFAREDVFIEKL